MRKPLLSFLLAAAACTGLHAGELVIGDVGPLSGPLGPNGLANYEGSKSCVDELNAAGGIAGNTLKLVREDDQYKPDETMRLLRQIAKNEKPIAFVNLLGSASVSAVLKEKMLDELKVPVVGVTPGADAFRSPGNPWLFHTHATDNAQLRRILSHLKTIGMERIAVVYQDLPFGLGGMKFIDEQAPVLKLTIAGRVAAPAGAEDLSTQSAQLRKAGAQAYVMVLAPNSGASFVRDVRKGGDTTPLYGMSYVEVKNIISKAGAENSVGVGLAQVTPNTFSASSGLVRQFHAAMDKSAPAGTPHSQLHLIGYLNCRVLAEGLKLAGGSPTPEKLQTALRKVRLDLGGYFLDFAGTNEASKYVDIGVVTKDGRLMY